MAGAISVLRNPVIKRYIFSVLAAVQTLVTQVIVQIQMQTDTNRYFDLNSCSQGMKIEVKQVDDNYTWLYNENQYLYVELSDFCNYG